MAISAGLIAKAAAAALSSEKVRKGVGWILTAVLSPVILIVALLCALGSGTAEHNNLSVQASFYGAAFSEKIPAEYSEHVLDMQTAFSLLDSAVASVNASAEDGGLDPIQVKSVFYALCFGEDAPSRRAANRFTECFYTTEVRTRIITTVGGDDEVETYTVNIPLPLEQAYANLAAEFGREISAEDKKNADHIYRMIAGAAMGGGSYDGSYLAGGERSIEIDLATFTDPVTKNNLDLVQYAINAWQSGWGYVWGTYGNVLTDGLLQSKINQYPDVLTKNAAFIRERWLGGRTTDCVGLIKGYGWLNADTLTIDYATSGMPDIGANQMYYSATESGTIDTIPEIPGLAVWHEGHIGVYIGNGEVIEAMGTKYGVVKTQLDGRGWTHWLKIPYIHYE